MIKHSAQILCISILSMFIFACGGGSSGSEPKDLPKVDSTPDMFSFSAISEAKLNTNYESNQVTISGINTDISISISNGTYAINNGDFVDSAGNVKNGDTLVLKTSSASTYDTETIATLTIDATDIPFSITTEEAPTVEPTSKDLVFNLNFLHQTANKSEFERERFITIHASHTENDWYSVGINESSDLIADFVEKYDVYFGRDTGGMAWQLQQLPEDTTKTGYASASAIATAGSSAKHNYSNLQSLRAQTQRKYEHRNQMMVVAAQQHPFWPDGKTTNNGWAFSQNDTVSEPFGTATGDYMGRFISQYFNSGEGDNIGQPKPTYVEVMNEPLYDLVDDSLSPESLDRVFKFHNHVADAIRAVEIDNIKVNQNIKIGGYTAAFPDFDKDSFNQWHNRDKYFIDLAGDKMDFLSIHLYDFPAFQGKQQYRKGSNLEATFDLLEQYTKNKFGQPKPMLISEYGAQVHSMLNQPWSPERDWQLLTATNSMLMSFLERPHLIEMVIPFITVKAEWGRTDVPYNWRLMRQKKEAVGETGEQWVYTDLIKFYQLWADVNGQRVESHSNDLDILTDAYVDNNKVYLILNNLEFDEQVLSTSVFGIEDLNIESVVIKHLLHQQGMPALTTTNANSIPEQITLGGEATMIIEATFSENVNINKLYQEQKYYADKSAVSITANQINRFNINNIDNQSSGSAMLRLSLARNHNLDLQPEITVNGHAVAVPSDYRGYDQYHQGNGRDNFYGVIEIPVSHQFLTANNIVNVTFDESGGVIASVALQYFSHDETLNQ